MRGQLPVVLLMLMGLACGSGPDRRLDANPTLGSGGQTGGTGPSMDGSTGGVRSDGAPGTGGARTDGPTAADGTSLGDVAVATEGGAGQDVSGEAGGADRGTDQQSSRCPEQKPTEGAPCSPGSQPCTYLIEPCPCGPSDIEWFCHCSNGGWSCSRGYDCYPCGNASQEAAAPTRRPSRRLPAGCSPEGCSPGGGAARRR